MFPSNVYHSYFWNIYPPNEKVYKLVCRYGLIKQLYRYNTLYNIIACAYHLNWYVFLIFSIRTEGLADLYNNNNNIYIYI